LTKSLEACNWCNIIQHKEIPTDSVQQKNYSEKKKIYYAA
jgi:hypothetical protein